MRDCVSNGWLILLLIFPGIVCIKPQSTGHMGLIFFSFKGGINLYDVG